MKECATSNVKIMILCGGRGSRMGKLTDDLPKPLIKIHGKPILEFKINRYIEQGFNEFVFCVGYKGELIKQFISTLNLPDHIKIIFSDSGSPSPPSSTPERAGACRPSRPRHR